MKKCLFIISMILLFGGSGFAALTGVKTIGTDYPTLAAAIADLNSSGVGAGGVTFNIPANYTETFMTPLDGYITTLTGSGANPIVFQKTGTGNNPVITAATGTGNLDAIISINGCDYVTFNGINLMENAANTTATTQMEWGYAILKASGTDGSQNITIKNCTINLNTSNTLSVGIYSNDHTSASATPLLTVTAVSGQNSNLKIFSNTINCYTGIYLNGFNDPVVPYLFYDQNNEIGKDGANTITNVAGQTSTGYGIYAQYQNNLKVANNSITSTMGGSGTPYGIYLTNANNANYDLYGNNVSMQFSGGTGTTAFYPVYADMGANGTSNVVNIYNNTVTGCTNTKVTTANTYLMYFTNLGVTTSVYGNTVSNNVTGSATATSTGRINYLYCNKVTTTQGPLEFHDNIVTGNSRVQSASGGGATYFAGIAGKGTLCNIYNNSIMNNVVGSNGGTYMIYAAFDIGVRNIYNNLISNITKAEGTVYGLYNYNVTSNSGTGYIYQNKIQSIESLTAGSVMYGIYSTATGGPNYYYNNMVSDMRPTAATTASAPIDQLDGIHIEQGTNVGIYYNTVYLAATSSGTNFGSSALYLRTGSGGDVRNNILVNSSVPKGTGKTVALRMLGSNGLSLYSALSNYNDLSAGTPDATHLIFSVYDNSSLTYSEDQTMVLFKTRVYPRDAQSITELPTFVNIGQGATDLHLQSSVATQCEAGGIVISLPLAITTDFDNNPRFPNAGYPVNGSFTPNAPDIGADEIGGLPNDITGPAIDYTPLLNTYNGNPRTLTATITDGTGVPVTGNGLPMLYWKVNAGSYQGVQGTYVSGSTYSFTFGSGTLNGDVVSYYVVAQDKVTTPNVTSKPWIGAAGFSANPPACSTPPTTPYTYTIMTGISGVYHVGAGKDYATLTAAAADINVKFISGPLTLILDDPAYPSESYPVTFTPNPGSSSTNTLTIKPNTGNSPVFSASVPTGILNLNGIDYLILDGSNNGTNSKSLTIQNTSTTSGSYGISLMNFGGTDPTTNVTIKNCIIKCTPVNSSVVSIICIKFNNIGGGYDNIIIDNNTIAGAFVGIQLYGVSAAVNHNCQVTNNIIGSALDAEAVSDVGVYLQYADNTLISNNEIMGPASGSLNVGQTGVYVGTGSTNTKIRKNRIHDFYHNSDDGWGATGIWYASDATTITEISNNLIYDIKAPGINPGVGQNITYGMFFRSGGNVKILHNSINLTGPWLSSLYDASSACLGFYYQATGGNFEVRNNILRNGTVLNGGPNLSGKAYGIMISLSATSMFSVINNNDFYIDGYNGSIAQQYTNGTGVVVEFPTLASWQATTGQEANSLTVDPQFTSSTNLIPTTLAMPHAGSYIASVPTDFAGVNRTNPPDIGAYEFTVNPMITTLAASVITNSSATLNGTVNPAANTVNLFFDWGLTSAYGTSVVASPASAGGTSSTSLSTNLSGLSGFTTYHYRARGVTSAGLIVYGSDMTFTTPPDSPSIVTTAATSVTTTSGTMNGTVNPNGGTATLWFEYGPTTAYGTTVNASPASVTGTTVTPVSAALTGLLPNTTIHYRLKGTNVTGTNYGSDMTFTTTALAAVVVTNFATAVGTTSAQLNGNVTANNAATTVTFQWGATTAYGNTINAIPSTVNGMSGNPVLASLTSLNINATYHFRCVGVNIAGTTYGLDQTFTTNCVAPVITISGPATACAASTGNVYTTQTGNSNYTWTVSAGGSITAGAGTSSITVTWNTVGAQTVSVNYNNTYGCSAPSATIYNVTVNPTPTPTITGATTACVASTNNIYTTQSQAGITNYVWTVSAGGTITAGTGTSSITVTWSTTGAKTVTVNYNNSSGCPAVNPAVFSVMVYGLPTPVISGTNNLCVNSGEITYTTDPGMSNYTWTVSAGGTITGGQGTSVVLVAWNTVGTQTVSVNYANANGCYAQTPTSYAVTVNPVPGGAGTITGTANVCGGAQGVVYSCSPIANTTYYVWTLPAGATIASGTGTNSVTVNYSANASSGNITVYGNNLCGNGAVSPSFPVTVTQLPAAAGTIIGQASVCQGTNGVTYSVPTIQNATGYTWMVPAGATIVSGSGSNSIVVDFAMNAQSGVIIVSGSNSCGSGTVSPDFTVTVNPVPGTPVITANGNELSSSASSGNQWYFEGNAITGATGQTYTASQSGWYWDVVTLSGCSSDTSNHVYIVITGIGTNQGSGIKLYPVPNNGRFTVSITTQEQEKFSISIYNSIGSVVYEQKDIEVNGNLGKIIDMRPVASGIYTVVLRNAGNQVIRKIVVD